MTGDKYLASYPTRIEELILRCEKACDHLTDEELNSVADGMAWSPAQILEHMMIANRRYLPILERAIHTGRRGNRDVSHTWFGKILIRGAGPDGNAPSPKVMHPPPGPYTREVLQRWRSQHEAILKHAEQAVGVDLTRTKFRNPFIKILTMNLYDAFELIAQHGERHVSQIEKVLASRPH